MKTNSRMENELREFDLRHIQSSKPLPKAIAKWRVRWVKQIEKQQKKQK